MKRIICTLLLALATVISIFAQSPDSTYLFAKRDTCDLFLDYYKASDKIESLDTKEKKPVVIFVFGGAFMTGKRSSSDVLPWFKSLNQAGYNVAAIDYRLGLKGVDVSKVNMATANNLSKAIDIAVEDLFSATAFLIDNATELGIDTNMIIASGSSAGAITSMQAEWAICNDHKLTAILPQGFNYAGIMSFSGAVFSMHGGVHYAKSPCPTLMFHGSHDSLVPYKKIALLGMVFAGSAEIVKEFKKNDFNYNFYRYPNRNHEICITMIENFSEEMRFLDENVKKGIKRVVDANVIDPGISVPSWVLELERH